MTHTMSTSTLEEILHPQSVAVVGTSNNPNAWGYSFTHHLLHYGYRGKIYPVNPRYSEVLGIKAYPNLRDVPGTVDYVISCVPASEVLNLLDDCSQKEVKVIHLYTARFSETGRQDAAELEQEILKQARKRGIRLIGPNCMGVYYPREGLSFAYDLPKEPGVVGMSSQTGGGAAIFVNLASMRGIRFSKIISYGNALDFNECDFLDYFSQDPETEIILVYIEGVRDGKRFLNSLRHAAATKPVIVTKGGRGESGVRAIASHTASLTDSVEIWKTLVAQAGAIYARDFDEMADLAVSFNLLPPIPGPKVGIVGGGGGPSVLSADECEESGLDVVPLPAEMRDELKNKGIQVWDWVGNPIDVSILPGFDLSGIDILRMMARDEHFDLLIGNITEVPLSPKKEMLSRAKAEVKGYIELKKETSKPLMVVVGEKSLSMKEHNNWRWKLTSEIRSKLIESNIPFYPTMRRAAKAARTLIDFYRRKEKP